MKSIYVRRSLYLISAFLMTLSFLNWGTAASTNTVFLTCHQNGDTLHPIYLTIDYSRGTVITSEVDDTKPTVDAHGHTSQPAQITDSQIVWQLTTKRAVGVATQHFTLSRLTGALGIYDDGFRSIPRLASQSWTCEVGAKPKPKF